MKKFTTKNTLKTNYSFKWIAIGLITLFFFSIINGSMAQKSIDTLNFATDREVTTSLIYGNSLFLGGNFNLIGKKTGPVAFFNGGSSSPDTRKPLFSTVNGSFSSDQVFAVLPDGAGGWFVGGNFSEVNNKTHRGLVHILSNNTLDLRLSPIWQNYNNVVSVMKRDGNYVYVGGNLIVEDEIQGKHYDVFRLDLSTMKVDAAWNPTTYRLTSGKVTEIEISNDKVFLSGWFGQVDGVDQGALMAVDKTSGSRISFPTSRSVSAMHVMGDTLLLAEPGNYKGFGYLANGLAMINKQSDIPSHTLTPPYTCFYASIPDGKDGWYAIGRYNNNGVYHLDKNLKPYSNFSQHFSYQAVGYLNHATNLYLNGNDLYVSANYGRKNPVDAGGGNFIQYLFKLDAVTGALDPNFKPNPNGAVRTMLIKNGILYVGGDFDSIGGEARSALAVLNPTTGVLQGWNPMVNEPGYHSIFPGTERYVSHLTWVNDTLYMGGSFQMPSASLPDSGRGIYGLARFDMATGSLDTSFHISTAYSDTTAVTIAGMAYKENKLYVTGRFNFNGVADTVKNVGVVNLVNDNLVPVNPDLEFSWNDQDRAPKMLLNDDILYLWGMGVRQRSTTLTRPYFVSLNVRTGKLTDRDPAPNKDVYTFSMNQDNMFLSGTFLFFKHYAHHLVGINTKTKQYVPFPDVQTVHSMVSSDKYIFVGGDFSNYGDSAVNGLCRLKRKGLTLTRFDHKISNSNKPAAIGMLSLADNGLYVVGQSSNMFDLVAGKGRQNICLLDPSTGHLKGWNPPPFNGKVLRVFASGHDVAISGSFGLMPVWKRHRLAKIDLSTGEISGWDPNMWQYNWFGGWLNVLQLAASGDTLFVGCYNAGGTNSKNLFALDAVSATFLGGFVPPVFSGALTSLSKVGQAIYVGGSFKTVNSVSHKYVAKINAQTGAAEAWDPGLEDNSVYVHTVLATDSVVYIGGHNLQIVGGSSKGNLLKVDASSGAFKKAYAATGSIVSLAKNKSGEIAAGTNNINGFLMLDKVKDTLVVPNIRQEFNGGIVQVKSVGNLFLAAGNGMKEFGDFTTKPGFLVYDPVKDTVINFFSSPVLGGAIKTFASDEKTLVFAGEFGGMNSQMKNADLAFMHMPDLYLHPGVSSWSPHQANNVDPFAVSVYGCGFSDSSGLTLDLSGKIVVPDSTHITNRKILAYFNGADFTPGKWNLKVKVTVKDTLFFQEAIKIEQGDFTDVWANWIGSRSVRIFKLIPAYIRFGNRGNRDAYGMLLYVAVGEGQTVVFPRDIIHLSVKFDVDWDTVPNFVHVDYFLGEPFHGKVYTLFIPYLPHNFESVMRLKIISSSSHEVRVSISKPIYQSYEQLSQSLKSGNGAGYDYFKCAYDVVGTVADLTPGIGCIKSVFDNTVILAVDKYATKEKVQAADIANAIGMTTLGCIPGGAEMKKAYKVAKAMAEMSGPASSCMRFASDCFERVMDYVTFKSVDPNAKYGPLGLGSSIHIPWQHEYQYLITFENDSAATAPAERVIVIDTLDKKVFDINSFKPIGFAFGDTTYFYKKTDGDTVDIDLRPDKNAIVRVFYHLSPQKSILTWTFLTLNPNTYELTDDVLDGFLPPNRKAPEGEGNVLYAITPLSGLSDSTSINNTAHIVFDWNKSIATDRWHNVTDNSSPESAVNALPAKIINKNFTVSWKGSDRSSGVFSYTVYVAENDSTYYPWLRDTRDTSAVFTGQPGNIYKFYSIAIDSAGNKEIAPAIYDAITQVSGTGIDKFGAGNKMQFRIYPNPAEGKVNIDYYLPENSRVRVDILNVCGYPVMDPYEISKSSGKKQVRINLSKLPAGYYFVRILTKYGVQTRKLVIQ